MSKETYTIRLECRNCDNQWVERIERGVETTGSEECPHCGVHDNRSLGRTNPFGSKDFS